MRLAAVPIRYAATNDEKMAQEVAWKQSKTTHQGHEAAHCACLLTHLIMKAINAPPNLTHHEVKLHVLRDIEVCQSTEGDCE